jgi:hypothetical protein
LEAFLMSGRLVPCPSCSRHVRAGEGACPFCLAALPEDLGAGPALVQPPGGLSRFELFRYGTRGAKALAGAVVGTSMLATASCGNNQAVPLYGIACFDCGAPDDDAIVYADAQVVQTGSEPSEDVTPKKDAGSPADAQADAPADAPQSEGGHGDGSSDATTPPG